MNNFYIRGNKWHKYLHQLRKKEIDIAFSKFHEKHFDKALELGAGDGYQSSLLIKYAKHLICTELNEARLIKARHPSISNKVCDAEIIYTYFPEDSFDLIFSSNMFEHLPNPLAALQGINKILKDSGIAILIMPSPFWAVTRLLLYYPGLIMRQLLKLSKNQAFSAIQPQLKKECCQISQNNLKGTYACNRNPIFDFIRLPPPHGISKNHFEEIRSFQRIKWINLFKLAGFKIVKVLKGPIAIPTAGGAFNFKLYYYLSEKFGFTSEFIYFLTTNDN